MDRITYQGAYVKANGKPLYRISSFGSSTNIPKEKLSELGNKDDFFVADEVATVDISLEGREWGSIENLISLANLAEATEKIHLRTDFDKAKAFMEVPVEVDDSVWTQFILDAYLTSYNLSYNVSGDATEGFGLSANHKYWYKGLVSVEDVDVADNAAIFTKTGTLKHLQSVSVGGEVLSIIPKDNWEYATNTVTLTDITGVTKVRGIFVGKDDEYPKFTKKDGAGTKRRAEIEVYLVKGHDVALFNQDSKTNAIDIQTGAKPYRLDKLQSLSLDASLNREDLYELGRFYPYHKALTLPLDISVNMEFIAADNSILAFLMGAEDIVDMTEYDVSKIVDGLGLVVYIYDKKDTDITRKKVRKVMVPKLLINSEGFNLSTDGNATSSFAFTGEDLAIVKV